MACGTSVERGGEKLRALLCACHCDSTVIFFAEAMVAVEADG